jgi:hypothetical protein
MHLRKMTMAKVDYDGYSVHVLDFAFRYVEGEKHVDFLFDLNSDVESPMVLNRRSKSCSEGIVSEDVARALDRICAHLKSIGYKVMLVDE